MAKYYVQSGTLKLVAHADSADRAALWAVHHILAQVLPVFDDQELSATEKQAVAEFRGMQVLEEEIAVSEHGFDGDTAAIFQTADLVTEWSQLVIALETLYDVSQRKATSTEEYLAV